MELAHRLILLLLTSHYNTNKGQVEVVDPNNSSDLPHDNYWHRYVGMPFKSILFYSTLWDSSAIQLSF